jgi:hypothetical protein
MIGLSRITATPRVSRSHRPSGRSSPAPRPPSPARGRRQRVRASRAPREQAGTEVRVADPAARAHADRAQCGVEVCRCEVRVRVAPGADRPPTHPLRQTRQAGGVRGEVGQRDRPTPERALGQGDRTIWIVPSPCSPRRAESWRTRRPATGRAGGGIESVTPESRSVLAPAHRPANRGSWATASLDTSTRLWRPAPATGSM